MKFRLFIGVSLALLAASFLQADSPARKMSARIVKQVQPAVQSIETAAEPLVQIALLIDTSGSMKGLVDQARYQLWNVVRDLADAKFNNNPIQLQIGVYQYGTDQVSASRDRLRQIVRFTDNLDEVSRGLFSLHVSGGDEYCGAVVKAAIDELNWSDDPKVYKAVFLAGNEYFDQGSITFGESLPEIKAKSIFVNTIYCGTKYDGREQWESAAGIAGGIASFIDHNHHLSNISTPYDSTMRELNREMNETFVWFGQGGEKASKNQVRQDLNAEKMSDNAFAARMSAKIGHLYHHVEHDLVDALQRGKAKLDAMPEAKMPVLLREMTPVQRDAYMNEMISKRETVRRKMADTLSRRHQFLEQSLSEDETRKVVLGVALRNAIRKQAQSLGFTFEQTELIAKMP